VNGKEYVDGGIADNCPIYPLVAIEQCTEFVVVRLNPGPRNLADVTNEIREIDRLERVRHAQPKTKSWAFDAFEYVQNDGFSKPYRYSNPPATIRFRDFIHLMPRISYVSPERSLGGLFSGTLNFSKAYSNKLIDMGWHAVPTRYDDGGFSGGNMERPGLKKRPCPTSRLSGFQPQAPE
jgi:hypothetical protein